jgi:protocatechuate 3,4-dioxygenase beta subunit
VTGAPLRKAQVVLYVRPANLVAESDAEGRFQFFALPSGTYRVSASKAGYFNHPTRVAVASGDSSAKVEIRLPAQGVISGHVADEDGDPLPNANVLLFKSVYQSGRRQWRQLNGGHSNAVGEYRIPDLKPGRYLVESTALRPFPNNRFGERDMAERAVATYVPTYYSNAHYQQDATPVEVGVGATVSGVDIHFSPVRMAPAVHVRGKVVGVPAGTQSGVQIAFNAADPAASSSSTAFAGTPDYEFDARVRPGEYRILAKVIGGPVAYASANITATADVDGVVLTTAPVPTVTGQISMAEHSCEMKFKSLRVNLAVLDSHFGFRPDATGKFFFAIDYTRAGHYSMYLESIPADCFVQSVKLGAREIDPEDCEISSSVNLDIILSSTAAKITGTVVDKDGNPLPDSIATLIPIDGTWPDKETADDSGAFQFKRLRPGKYKLFAWEQVDNDVWQDPAFWKKYESYAAEITVGPSETQSIQLRVIPTAEIR